MLENEEADKEEKKTLLGRPGNNLKIGIVGLFAVRRLLVRYSVLLLHRPAKRREIVIL